MRETKLSGNRAKGSRNDQLRPNGRPGRASMTSALVLIVGAAVPWVVHLAAPRQRLLALAAAIVVIVLFTLFSSINPVLSWQLWVGLIAGLATVVAAVWFTGRSGDDDYYDSPPAGRLRESPSETTGEL